MHKLRRNFTYDAHGFSTTLDIFLFLIMISISAVILLPSITGNTQIKAVIETKNQKQSSDVLLTLINSRVDDFEYSVAGEQMDAVAGSFNNSPIYLRIKKLFAGHELKHRTFSDIAAENAASQWVIYSRGNRIQLNFLMNNYSSSLDDIVRNHLDKQIGDRYNYNFSVVWQPFANVPIGGYVRIGEKVPDNAYTESTYITMPYHVNFTRKRVEGIIDRSFNTTFGNISSTFDELKNPANRSQAEDEIYLGIFDSVNETLDEAVAEMVDNSIGALDNENSRMIEQVNDSLPSADILLTGEIKESINATLQERNASTEETLSSKITAYLREVAKEEVQRVAGDEIKEFTDELSDMYNNDEITIEGVKERILDEVFSRISISRAKLTLAIWEKKV